MYLLFRSYEMVRVNIWSRNIEVSESGGVTVGNEDDSSDGRLCQITSLNLAHNQLTSVPVMLPCLAVQLTRLNLSYNRYILFFGTFQKVKGNSYRYKSSDCSQNTYPSDRSGKV